MRDPGNEVIYLSSEYLPRITLQYTVLLSIGSCILNYTRNQFCGGRKPECPEETLEVRLRSTVNAYQCALSCNKK